MKIIIIIEKGNIWLKLSAVIILTELQFLIAYEMTNISQEMLELPNVIVIVHVRSAVNCWVF